MDLVLFGIQGSGKGTVASAVAERFGFAYFETGAELRKLAQEDTPLAKKVKSIMDAGNLVPNEVVMEIIEEFMKKVPEGKSVLFDGIPRKPVQATTFDSLMRKLGRDFTCILIDVPEEMAKERLLGRNRSDDTPGVIQARFQNYLDETVPVIENYRAEGKLLSIDGKPPIPEVRESVFQLIQEKHLA